MKRTLLFLAFGMACAVSLPAQSSEVTVSVFPAKHTLFSQLAKKLKALHESVRIVSGDGKDDYTAIPSTPNYHKLAQEPQYNTLAMSEPVMYDAPKKERGWDLYWQKLPRYQRLSYKEPSPGSMANNTPELDQKFMHPDNVARSNNPCAPYPCEPYELSSQTSTIDGLNSQSSGNGNGSSSSSTRSNGHRINNGKSGGGHVSVIQYLQGGVPH